MATEEKLLTIPLRAEWLKKPRIHRTQRSVIEIKSYLYRYMKATDVKMSELLNEAMWKGGAKGSISKIKVKASKDDKGLVTVMLPEEKLVVEEKKGIGAKILRRKGKVTKRIVLDEPKGKTEVDNKGTKLTSQLPTEAQLPSKTDATKTEVEKISEQKPADLTTTAKTENKQEEKKAPPKETDSEKQKEDKIKGKK